MKRGKNRTRVKRAGASRARTRPRPSTAGTGAGPVLYGSIKTPIGRVFVARSERGVFDLVINTCDERSYRARLEQQASRVVRDDRALNDVLREIDGYFSGRLRAFATRVDLRSVTPFTRRVLAATLSVPFGSVTSYGELARRIGVPTGARAVGGALGRNPVPIIVPCHRVVRSGGHLGGFSGGLHIKRKLLEIERREPKVRAAP